MSGTRVNYKTNEDNEMATIKADFDGYKIWYYSGHPYEALIYVYKKRNMLDESFSSRTAPQYRLMQVIQNHPSITH